MEETFIVLMEKNLETGFFEKEICTLKIIENENLITNAFVFRKENNSYVNMKLSIEKDASDEEYDLIYDYYETDIFEGLNLEIEEFSDSYNPTWELVFDYINNDLEMEEKISKILSVHKKELEEVYKLIKKEGVEE